MANPGEGLQIAVGANIKALEKQMRAAGASADRAAKDIEDRFRRTNPSLNLSAATGALKGFVAAFTLDRMIRGLAAANSALVEIGETAKRVGMTTDQIQALQFASRTNGLTGKQFGTGIEGLAERLNESRQQETALGKLFEENNLKLKDRKGNVLDVSTALGQVANLTKNAATEFDKIKIAEAAGLTRDWVPLLEQGADAIAKQASEARATGNIIDSDLIAKAKTFEQDWSAATERWSNLIKANAGSLIGLIDTLISKAGGLAGTIGDAVSKYATRVSAVADIEQNGVQGASRGSLEWAVGKGRELGVSDADMATATKRLDELRELDRETARAAGFPKTKEALTVNVNKPGTKTSSLFNSGSKGGGGASSSGEDRTTSVERYVAALQKAQAVAQAEAQTAGLTSIERAKAVALAKAQAAAQQDVKNELRETAVLTDEEKNKILGAAEATEQWRQSARDVKDSINFAKDLTSDVAKGFVDDLLNGTKAADALNNALKRIVQTLANKAIESLIGGMFGGSSGGGTGVFGTMEIGFTCQQ